MSVEKRDYLELIRQAQRGADPYQPPAPKPRPQPQVPPPAATGGHGGYAGVPASTLSGKNGYNGCAPQQQQQQAQNPAFQGSVPDIPGVMIDRDRRDDLARHVASLCGLSHVRFPGAQPVSFLKKSIQNLLQEDFWVCEKSDGQRVLIFIVVSPFTMAQEVYLIDRKNDYRQLEGLYFPAPRIEGQPPPNPADPSDPGMQNNTLLDGELVSDTEKSGRKVLRLLLFDAIVINGENIMQRTLSKRYGRLRAFVYDPFFKYMVKHPDAALRAPFEIKVKHMDMSYHIEHVMKVKMKELKHESDGLIFTCMNSTYRTGTDEKILKWKPPGENSIDFKLRLRFPGVPPDGKVPDLRAKPFFQLDQYAGGRQQGRLTEEAGYEYFDWMDVSDAEWEEMKGSGIQYDDRVIECVWSEGGEVERDPRTGEDIVREPRWVMKRIRDDKVHPNHKSVVQNILISIVDGVEQDELLEIAPAIRTNWKTETRGLIRDGKVVEKPRRGGPGPPMRDGGTLPDLIRR